MEKTNVIESIVQTVARLKRAKGGVNVKKMASGAVLGILVVFSLLSTISFAEETITKKTMDVNATVDLGKNTKELLEQGGTAVTKIMEGLAKSLGMTVEKIFPYYVKQTYIEGTTSIIVWGGFEVSCLSFAVILLILSSMYGKKGDDDFKSACGAFSAIVFVIFGLGLIIGTIHLPHWITMVKNPEYVAIQSMIQDASKFIGK